jgi:protein O-mannosyl-transferase
MAKKELPPAGRKLKAPALFLVAGILVFTSLLYLGSLHGEFLSYDDTTNVTDNVLVRHLSPEMAVQCFSRAVLYMYTPITTISYAIDYHLSGPDPFFFKLTSLLLHLLNAALLFLLARKLFKNRFTAALMALLFAVHPLNADSVSWISARSNLLSALFFILSLLFYMHCLEGKKVRFFILAAMAFLLSLLSKTAGIMLPVTMLLLDYLLHRKITARVVLEKLPLVALSLAAGLAALYFRSDAGTPQSIMEYTLSDRFVMTCYSLCAFLFRAVFPFSLSAVYAYPVKNGELLPLYYYLAPPLIIALAFAVSRLKVLRREMIFGLLFFLVNVLVTQAVLLEDGFMANRYGYIPCLGLWFILAAWVERLSSGTALARKITFTGLALLLTVFAASTWQRSQVWNTTLSLFNDAVEHSPGSAFAWNNRGIARYARNDPEGALSDYSRAITIFPGYSGAYYNRGIAWYAMKEFGRAGGDYDSAIVLNPGFASCYMARGILEMDVLQNDTLALADYNRAVALNPSMAQAYYNRGILFLRMKNVSAACENFHQVRRLGYDRADDLIRQFCE